MATPRRPFVRIPLGYLEQVLEHVQPSAALLLARLWTHRDKRNVPGLLRMGVAGLSESLVDAQPSAVKRDLYDLEATGFVLLDLAERPPLIYVRGAVEADPPTSENSWRGMARQVRDLPLRSTVTVEVRRAIAAALIDSPWLQKWREEVGPDPESSPDAGPGQGPSLGLALGPDAGPGQGPLRRSIDPEILRSGDPTTHARAGLDPSFVDFWNAYPRKVGKDDALKVWRAKKFTGELIEQILTAIAEQRQSRAWQKDGGQFIPHPATWLRQGRWQDVIIPDTEPDLTPAELHHAREVHRKRMGCRHETRCISADACVLLIAYEIREKAKAS